MIEKEPEKEKPYDPKSVEERWYAAWIAAGSFHADPSRPGDPYTIVIPPPNVTGSLHMGHALNITLQDVLLRYARMNGRNALWLPGTDHAGIATQNVVERELAKEGISRQELGREAFIERVWKWKEQSGGTILNQLKRLGAACDWERERFTMDEGLSRAVREAFVRLYRKGLVYRGRYIINWCPRCRTALSDLEVSYVEKKGALWYIRYPGMSGEEGVVVATTRPETMLGDTAVAVNPKDDRYAGRIGTTLRLPLMNRPIPVVADEMVDREFGTGAVKITPAHDVNDFEVARRHGLPSVRVIDESGAMTRDAGAFAGMDRFACRDAVVAKLAEEGLLVREEPYLHNIGHCYRCRTVVEPSESMQWFVKTKPLAAPAIRAVREGETRIVPAQWEKTYYEWMENIHDWCISRQIWWGHRIPAFHCRACGKTMVEIRPADAVRGVRGDRHPAGRGRSRHLVLLRPLAVLDPRVARKDGGSRTVLPHVRAGDGIRHPLLLGRADDDDGDRVHGESPLPRRGDPRPRPGRRGREDEQDAGERHRPPRRDRPVRHRRLPLHPRRAGRPGTGHPDVRRPGRGVPQLHEQAVPGGPLRPDARRRGDGRGSFRTTCR